MLGWGKVRGMRVPQFSCFTGENPEAHGVGWPVRDAQQVRGRAETQQWVGGAEGWGCRHWDLHSG